MVRALVEPYARAFRHPGARAFFFTVAFARLGVAMLPLAVIMLIERVTGQYEVAGASAAVLAAAGALGGPLTARLADRAGQPRTLPPLLGVHAVGVAGIVWASMVHAPVWALCVWAAFAGGAVPQFSSLSRARWATLVRDPAVLETAFAAEALTDDVAYIAGPAIAGLLSAGAHPAAGCLVGGVLVLGPGLAFALLTGSTAPVAESRARPPIIGPLRLPGIPLLAGPVLGIGVVFGTIQVSLTAFAAEHGAPGSAGLLYGVFAFASMIAGFVYGSLTWHRDAHTRLTAALSFLALTGLLLALPDGVVPMGALIVVPGLAVSPILISTSTLLHRVAPPHMLTESFAIVFGTANAIGVAVGSYIAGHAVEIAGARWTFMIVPAVALLAALFTAVIRAR